MFKRWSGPTSQILSTVLQYESRLNKHGSTKDIFCAGPAFIVQKSISFFTVQYKIILKRAIKIILKKVYMTKHKANIRIYKQCYMVTGSKQRIKNVTDWAMLSKTR